MSDTILVGRGKHIHEVPAANWREHLEAARAHVPHRLSFMTEEHHRVRNFVVYELPRNEGKALRTEDIARRLDLALERVVALLAELQRGLFFLVLNAAGDVSWAFPMTAERTPHALYFSSGEEIWAA